MRKTDRCLVTDKPLEKLWFENPQLQLLDGSIVPHVARAQGESVFRRRSGDDGISCQETVRQRIFLNVDGRSVADIFAQRKNLKAEYAQEVQNVFMLSFFFGPLKQLHVGQHGKMTFRFSFDQHRSTSIPPLDPNEDVGIKEHDIDLP